MLSPFIDRSSYGAVSAVDMKEIASGHILVANSTSGTVFVFGVRMLHGFSNGEDVERDLVSNLGIASDGTVCYRLWLSDRGQDHAAELGSPIVDLPLQVWADLNSP